MTRWFGKRAAAETDAAGVNEERRACLGCRWWVPVAGFTNRQGTPSGECRQRAPRIFQVQRDDKLVTRWPLVGEQDFCGEWRQQIEQKGTPIREQKETEGTK